LIAVFAVISLLTYMYAVYIRPSYAPLPTNKSDEEFLDLLKRISHQHNKKICAYCQIEKPDRARHCFICKRCVLDHDKHCYMLNNCVGKENRIFVIAYLLSTVLLLGTMGLSSFFHLIRVVPAVIETAQQRHFLKGFVITLGVSTLVIMIVMIYFMAYYCKRHIRMRNSGNQQTTRGS